MISLPSDHSADLTQAIARLEIEGNLPKLTLPVFDGSAILWPRFIEQFYIHVDTRFGLTDSRRMNILQSHVEGEAQLLIQGLGYSSRNYAQCLKELKFAFGHRALVAKALLNDIITGSPVSPDNAISLRHFYTSVRDCIKTLKQNELQW